MRNYKIDENLVGCILVIKTHEHPVKLNLMETPAMKMPSVLLVDDEEDLLWLIKTRLQKEGFNVQISPNGAHILDIILQSRPDIILLDIRLKDIDGATICSLLKTNKITESIAVLMFSANHNIQTVTQLCGADGFIAKPFDTMKVKNTLLDIYNHRHQA